MINLDRHIMSFCTVTGISFFDFSTTSEQKHLPSHILRMDVFLFSEGIWESSELSNLSVKVR